MIVNKYFLIGLHLLVTYHAVKTFVILSANVDDVKKIAKEFSGPLTDEIVGLILKATKNYTLNASNEDEPRHFKSHLNLPLKLKYQNIIRTKKESIQPARYYTDDINAKETPQYSYYMAPKIHNYAEVKTEVQKKYSTPKEYNVVSLSNHILPPQAMKKISMETLRPQENPNDDLNMHSNIFKEAPKVSSQNEPNKYQRDPQIKIATPQVPKISIKISDEPKIYNNVDLNHVAPSQLPKITSKKYQKPNKYRDDDQNNIDVQMETTKKRDTSTKIIEWYSESNQDTDVYEAKPSSMKRKKKAKIMQTKEVTNQEMSEKTSLETEVTIKTKTKRNKAVPVTTPTTIHNDDKRVDLELQKFEKEVRNYFTSTSSPSTTSEAASQEMTENKHSRHRNVKSKRHKKRNRKHRTEGTTLNIVRLVEKVERLDQVAQKIMSSTTTTTTMPTTTTMTMPTTTTKKVSPTRPTPAYPKQEDYKIPNSEFKLSYDPNQKQDLQSFNQMYAQYFKRNQMIKKPESNVHRTNTIEKLSEVIQKIIETRLDSKLSDTTTTEYSSRRHHIASRSTEVRHMGGILTNSEEEAMFKIIKAMIDSKKVNELKSPRYVKEQKRSTIKAFNIHKMSPEENMADVIHKMVDSSLRMQFEKPQMSLSALAETLKNKYYENDIESGNKKVSEMIEKLIEKKIQKYAQNTTKTAHSKQYQDKTRPNNHKKDKTWPSIRTRTSYKNIARTRITTVQSSPPTRYQTRTRASEVEKVGRIEFQIPYAQYPRTSTSTNKPADETFDEEHSSKWYKNQYTSPLPGSTIKISRGLQGPISIVIEDKESDEVKRPLPQAFLLQKPQTTHRVDPHIIVVDNRHIDQTNTKASYWEKELKSDLIKKILREGETTKSIVTKTNIRDGGIRSSDDKQCNDGGKESNMIPNVQLVFLSLPQLETKEKEKKILRENQKTEEEKRKEEEKRREQQKRNKEIKQEEEMRKKEEKRQEQEKRIEEERMREDERRKEAEKRREQEKRLEEKMRKEDEMRRERERKEEEKRIDQEKRLEEEKRRLDEEKRKEMRQEEKRLAEKRKLEEKRIEEEKRKEEEIRKEVEGNEKKALRQKIEKEIKLKEILDRKWEKELENKIKEKQGTDAIAALREAEMKKLEAEKNNLNHQLHFMHEEYKYNKDFLKHRNETQTTQNTPSITLNYWERQWQQDQEMKLKEEYNKYMKLHNAGPELSEKTIHYWNEQWRVDLEKKLKEKQKEEYESTKTTHNKKWLNSEISTTNYNLKEINTEGKPSLVEMVRRPSYAFGDLTEDQENSQIELSKPAYYEWRSRDKLNQKRLDSERSMLQNTDIRSYSKSRPNRFDARRDDDYSDTIYIMPDSRKRDRLVIKRVHDRSNRVTAIENMSEEHAPKNNNINRIDDDIMKSEISERIYKNHHNNKYYDDVIRTDTSQNTNKNHHKNKYNDDVIKSDTIIKEEKIDWQKPERTKSKKVTDLRVHTEERNEKKNYVERSSEIITSENDMKQENDKTESSEPIKEINDNILRTKTDDKLKSKHKKDTYELVDEEKKEDQIRNKKSKKKKGNKNDKHERRKKKKTEKEPERKEMERKNKNNSRDQENGNLSKENENFVRNHKQTAKRERKTKHSKRVKKENEEEEEKEHKKHKRKHKKPKNKKIKKDADNEKKFDSEQERVEEHEENEMQKRKHRKEKKEYLNDEENERENILEKEIKTKHNKREKDTSELDNIKERKVKNRKGEKDNETRVDKSKEKDATIEKEDKKTKKKRKRKKKKSDKGESHQKKEQDSKKSNKSEMAESHEKKEEDKKKNNKNDEDDGGKEFDFQLMFGEKGRGD